MTTYNNRKNRPNELITYDYWTCIAYDDIARPINKQIASASSKWMTSHYDKEIVHDKSQWNAFNITK